MLKRRILYIVLIVLTMLLIFNLTVNKKAVDASSEPTSAIKVEFSDLYDGEKNRFGVFGVSKFRMFR